METELNLGPDPELMTDPDPKLQIIPDPQACSAVITPFRALGQFREQVAGAVRETGSLQQGPPTL